MSSTDKGHNIVNCTRCRTNIDTAVAGGNVKFCPNCGNQLFTPPPQHKTNYCPSCGNAMSAPFDYCPGCGTQLNDAASDKYTSPEDYPPTPAELAAAKKGFVTPTETGQSADIKPVITDPKLKKLYKQWAAYSDLPEEALPVMEKPRPVQAPPRHPAPSGGGVQLSGILADIPPRYLFIGAVTILALILILAIAIAL